MTRGDIENYVNPVNCGTGGISEVAAVAAAVAAAIAAREYLLLKNRP
ncbi:hypothetical protein [Corynebacterium caspium]|nr:hypothetical protein [Corynebacterium caspium]WKD59984.1 hypothetical protein CCASP_08045 [Corynebacterium caspium DSM 44850]